MASHKMSEQEVRAFLTSTPARTGKLATVRADGRPHVAPIWYLVDDDGALIFNTGEETVKGRNLRHDGRAAICVDDDRPPFSVVVVEGEVEIITELAQVRESAARLGARYMGDDRAEEYGVRNGVPGELLIRFLPSRVYAVADLAD